MKLLLSCICVSVILVLGARAEAPAEDLATLETRLAYEAAVDFADGDEIHAAIRRLEWVIAQPTGTEWTARAEGMLLTLEELRDAPEPMSGATRAGLVTFGTVFTTWLGMGTLIVTDGNDPSAMGIALLGGPIVGLYYSVRATGESRLSDGQASLVNLGGVWGVWQGVGAGVVAGVGEKGTVLASMLGGLAGLGGSHLIVSDRRVRGGDASLISAAGAWGTWLTLCGMMASDVDETDIVVIAAMLGGDAALLGGALSAPTVNMSRSRVRLINAAGLVGTLYGWGATVLGDIDADRGQWSAVGVGSIAGLVTGAYLTRNMDDDGDSDDFFSTDQTTGFAAGPALVTYSVAF